jgi:hypothetical protein
MKKWRSERLRGRDERLAATLFDTALEVDAVEAAALHRLLHVLLEEPPEMDSIKIPM